MTTDTPAAPSKRGTTRSRSTAAERARAAGATVPQDRRPSADELQAEALRERPAAADLLRPPGELRARDRAKVLKLGERMRASAEKLEGATADDAADDDKITAGVISIDLVVEFDEVLEQFAIDPDQYARWGTAAGGGPNPEQRIAELFVWYVNALGE